MNLKGRDCFVTEPVLSLSKDRRRRRINSAKHLALNAEGRCVAALNMTGATVIRIGSQPYMTSTLRTASPFSKAVIASFTSSSGYVRVTNSSSLSFFCL